jgi:hypothetical protein
LHVTGTTNLLAGVLPRVDRQVLPGARPTRSSGPLPSVHGTSRLNAPGSLDSADLEIYTLAYSLQSSRQQRVDALSRTLGVNATVANAMVIKQPKLLDMPADLVTERLCALSRTLRVSREGIVAVLSNYPFLLLKSAGEMGQHLDRISQALGVTAAPVCQLIVKQPFVLQSSSQALQEKFDTICAAIAPLERERVAYLVAALPDLILIRTDTISSNMQSLQQLFGLTPQQASELVFKSPGLLLRHAEMTQRDLFLLANYMDVSFPVTAALVAKHPELLGTSWQIVKQHFDNLCTFFGGMPRESVVELVMSNPALLPLLSNPPGAGQ